MVASQLLLKKTVQTAEIRPGSGSHHGPGWLALESGNDTIQMRGIVSNNRKL